MVKADRSRREVRVVRAAASFRQDAPRKAEGRSSVTFATCKHRHRELWPARNRPGGLRDSLATFDRIGRDLALNYTVVTNNTAHYEKIPGIEVVNWS